MSAELLWQPSAARIERATLTRFARERGLSEDYGELWRWSVDHLDEFWAAIWDFFDVEGSYDRVLGCREMPGAEWFPGARLSYARHIFRGKDDEAVAIRHASELRDLGEWSWGDLREQTARIATSESSLPRKMCRAYERRAPGNHSAPGISRLPSTRS